MLFQIYVPFWLCVLLLICVCYSFCCICFKYAVFVLCASMPCFERLFFVISYCCVCCVIVFFVYMRVVLCELFVL